MKNEIKLFKNNTANKDWDDMDWIQEFNRFLLGYLPEGISIPNEHLVKLTPNQAYIVLWYLREHFSILPDSFTKCDNCDSIYDDGKEGYYFEKGNEIGNNFCGGCDHLAPYEDED